MANGCGNSDSIPGGGRSCGVPSAYRESCDQIWVGGGLRVRLTRTNRSAVNSFLVEAEKQGFASGRTLVRRPVLLVSLLHHRNRQFLTEVTAALDDIYCFPYDCQPGSTGSPTTTGAWY
eukprot:1603046-Rhodomonas_salina.1